MSQQQPQMRVQVLSPAKPLAEVDAVSVSVPGTLGMMEILANHAPLVAEVDVGPLRIKKANGEVLSFFVSGGYVDVLKNEVKVLVDVGENPTDIDRARAESSLKRAEERLVDIQKMNLDIARAQYAKKRAQMRLTLLDNNGQSKH